VAAPGAPAAVFIGALGLDTSRPADIVRHGGHGLIEQLAICGTRTIFLVPGESFLAALDGLHDSDSIDSIICRHEGAAAMMAQASARVTGQPGVVFVTRGPGIANAVSGIFVAQQDETPLVVLVGLPPTHLEGLKPFQDIDLSALFSGLAKSTAIVRRTADIPAAITRAFHLAASGRPGPVVVGLPEDVLKAPADELPLNPFGVAETAPSPHSMTSLEALLETAQSPLMIVGGPGWNAHVKTQVEAFAQRFDIPVATSFRCQDYFDNRHPSYIGHIGFGLDKKLAAGLRIADIVIVAGAPLGEVTTAANTLIAAPVPRQKLVHIHPDANEIGNVHATRLGIVSNAAAFAGALGFIEPPAHKPWTALRRDLRAAYEASLRPPASAAPLNADGPADLARVIQHLSDTLPETAILTNGAGNYSQFLHRHFAFKTFGTSLGPASGSMGYGLPAAIAAKLAYPGRTVVCLAGDGCLMMTLPDLATAVQYGLNIVILVANNGLYGTIRMHQESAYPGRVSGTKLINPDFASLARSFGATGERVETMTGFAPAFERACRATGPALLDLIVDPDAIAPGKTLSGLGKMGLADAD